MIDCKKLVKALRNSNDCENCIGDSCPYVLTDGWCDEDRLKNDAADAIERLNGIIDVFVKE